MSDKRSVRNLWEIDDDELTMAVAKMCDELNISGSALSLYDLYRAVLGEKRKAAKVAEMEAGDES